MHPKTIFQPPFTSNVGEKGGFPNPRMVSNILEPPAAVAVAREGTKICSSLSQGPGEASQCVWLAVKVWL